VSPPGFACMTPFPELGRDRGRWVPRSPLSPPRGTEGVRVGCWERGGEPEREVAAGAARGSPGTRRETLLV
jgi:hypothetical protein